MAVWSHDLMFYRRSSAFIDANKMLLAPLPARHPPRIPIHPRNGLTCSRGASRMSEQKNGSSRRDFLTNSSRIAGASVLSGIALPHVHAAENSTIQLALVGAG